uniref:ANK_REP_REGION domain-containing protein n=1 Tax=Anopheles dirus TaxID=7168 RepID=A0A182N1G0_9DIPT
MSSRSTFFYELVRKTPDEIEQTLSEQPELLTTKDENERYLLHWAALGGQEALVQSILERHAAQLDAEDDTKATPLILAVLGGHRPIVTLLTVRGATVNHRNWRGHSALQYACSKGYPDIAAHLVERGADVNATDELNETPLHRATARGLEPIMELLLAHGANPNLANREGNTPLHLACEEDRRGCALLLLRAGAYRHAQNRYEKTPLDLASRSLLAVIASELETRQAG